MGWIAVDFDGTLVTWGDRGPITASSVLTIGQPIRPMIERVLGWLAEGREVRIFTARVGPATIEEATLAFQPLIDSGDYVIPQYANMQHPVHLDFVGYQHRLISAWCREYLGQELPVTAVKDFHMEILFDDRAVQVISNTGVLVVPQTPESTFRAHVRHPDDDTCSCGVIDCPLGVWGGGV